LSGSLKKEADATLFVELAVRGYDLSKLRENAETTAEILKIG
jgi:broad-specificity NMP kinase